jgi:hypothetical protein
MSVRVSCDASQAIAGIDSIIAAIPSSGKETIDRVGNKIIDGAKDTVPVLTGRLQRSIRRISADERHFKGGTDTVEYARTVHEGLGRGRNAFRRPYISSQVNIYQHEIVPIFLQLAGSRIL